MFKVLRNSKGVITALNVAEIEMLKETYKCESMIKAIKNTLYAGFFENSLEASQMAAAILHGDPGMAKTMIATRFSDKFCKHYNEKYLEEFEEKMTWSIIPISQKTLTTEFVGAKDLDAARSGFPIINPESGKLNTADILIVDDLTPSPLGDLPPSIEALRTAITEGYTEQFIHTEEGTQNIKVIHRTQCLIFTSNVDFGELGKSNKVIESFNSRCLYNEHTTNFLFLPKQTQSEVIANIQQLLKRADPSTDSKVIDAIIYTFENAKGPRRPTPRDVVMAAKTLNKKYKQTGKIEFDILKSANIGLDKILFEEIVKDQNNIPRYEDLEDLALKKIEEIKNTLALKTPKNFPETPFKDILELKRYLEYAAKVLKELPTEISEQVNREISRLLLEINSINLKLKII
jgi:hypothetical protein